MRLTFSTFQIGLSFALIGPIYLDALNNALARTPPMVGWS
jgi:hypothetical protein